MKARNQKNDSIRGRNIVSFDELCNDEMIGNYENDCIEDFFNTPINSGWCDINEANEAILPFRTRSSI